MADAPVTNVIRTRLMHQTPTFDFGTAWYWKYSGAILSDAELADFNASVAAEAVTHLGNAYNSSVTVVSSDADDLTSGGASGQVATIDLTGAIPGNLLPISTCYVISCHELDRYRGGHPRKYLPNLGEGSNSSEDAWFPGIIGPALAAWNSWFLAVETWAGTGSPIVGVNVHRASGNVPLLPPVALPITALSIDLNIRSQRRRLGPS